MYVCVKEDETLTLVQFAMSLTAYVMKNEHYVPISPVSIYDFPGGLFWCMPQKAWCPLTQIQCGLPHNSISWETWWPIEFDSIHDVPGIVLIFDICPEKKHYAHRQIYYGLENILGVCPIENMIPHWFRFNVAFSNRVPFGVYPGKHWFDSMCDKRISLAFVPENIILCELHPRPIPPENNSLSICPRIQDYSGGFLVILPF